MTITRKAKKGDEFAKITLTEEEEQQVFYEYLFTQYLPVARGTLEAFIFENFEAQEEDINALLGFDAKELFDSTSKNYILNELADEFVSFMLHPVKGETEPESQDRCVAEILAEKIK